MKLGSRSPVLGAMATIALWLLNVVPASGQAATAKQLMTEQAFKDVTVLKGIPVELMHEHDGVHCNCTDCHAEPKAEAQDITRTNFGGARVVTGAARGTLGSPA